MESSITTTGNEQTTRPSAATIENWLCERIATKLRADRIDPEQPMGSVGLDSMLAMRLLDELEQWLGETLPPSLPYDYPSVRAMSEALASGQYLASSEYVAPDEDCY